MAFTPEEHMEPLSHRLLSGHSTPSLESWGWLTQSAVTQQEERAGGGEEGPEKRLLCHLLIDSVQCMTVLGTHVSGHSSLGLFACVGLPSGSTAILLRALLGPQRMWTSLRMLSSQRTVNKQRGLEWSR